MNKRKAPVMLFGLVVVAIAVMTVVNAGSKPNDFESQMQQKQEEVKQRDMTEEDRKKAAAEAVESLPSKNDEATKGPTRSKNIAPAADQIPGASMAPAREPTILIKKYVSTPPKPNDSSTATHWYDEESRSAKLADENAKSRG